MDYKINPKRLTIVFLLFVALIIIGLITLRMPELEYEVSASEALANMSEADDEICFKEAQAIMEEDKPGFTFIDLRNPYEYMKGHIEGALNIQSLGLLEKENIKLFDAFLDDNITMVLYGQDQSSVNGAVQILKQVGYKNAVAMRGGYSFYLHGSDSIRADSIPDHLAEDKWYDYAKVMGEELIFESLGKPSPKKSAPVTVSTKAVSKPKPKPVLTAPVEEEEPEGC